MTPDFSPLEPRLLMDASLGWDLSGHGSFADMVSGGGHQLLEDQLAGLDNVLEHFADLTQPALAILDSFAADGTGDSAAKIDELADRLRQAMEQLRLGSQESLRALSFDTAAPETADDLRAAVASALGAVTISDEQLGFVFGFDALSGNLVGQRRGRGR